MTWREILLVLIRCELNAKYSHFSGWQFSAKKIEEALIEDSTHLGGKLLIDDGPIQEGGQVLAFV